MKYTFQYLLLHNRDYSKHDIYTKIFALLVTTIPTWILLNYTKISANAVTFFGFLSGISGAIIGYFLGTEFVFYGFMIFLICDFVDGNVAKAKGGSTYFGAIIDMLSDRLVLMSCAFVMSFIHLTKLEQSETLYLLVYILLFLFMDIIQLALFIAKDQQNIPIDKSKVPIEVQNNLSVILSDPSIWIPSRLGSYLFVLLTYFVTASFLTAYMLGIVAILLSLTHSIINSKTLKSMIFKE